MTEVHPIEAESYRIMRSRIDLSTLPPLTRAVTERIIHATADFGYFRLRDEGYKRADITRWSQAIVANAPAWKETFVYFKHEGEGKGPAFARMLKKLHPTPRAGLPRRAVER